MNIGFMAPNSEQSHYPRNRRSDHVALTQEHKCAGPRWQSHGSPERSNGHIPRRIKKSQPDEQTKRKHRWWKKRQHNARRGRDPLPPLEPKPNGIAMPDDRKDR